MRDLDVRLAVRTCLNDLHRGEPDTRIVEEMGVWAGAVRIDIAVINGELCGFELKSDRDTLERLPLQAEIYSRVFDRLELVVGARHWKKAECLVPKWWGITVASDADGKTVSLEKARTGSINPSPDAMIIAQLLWKEEAVSVLEACNLAKGWRSSTVKKIHNRLASELSLDDLRRHVRAKLKCRGTWLGKTISD